MHYDKSMNLYTMLAAATTQTPAPAAAPNMSTPVAPAAPAIAPVGGQALDGISVLAEKVGTLVRSCFPGLARSDRALLADCVLTIGTVTLAIALYALCSRLSSRFMRGVLRIGIAGSAIIGLLTIWVPEVLDWFETAQGSRIGGSALTIFVAIVVNSLLWEGANRFLTRYYLDQTGDKSQRLRTLLPLLRRAIYIVLLIVTVLTILTELGINIAPLLAGAGVVGIAIGLGAQKLVQDLITGLSIVLEDAISLGDSVTIDTHSGVVEDISLRTVRLRDINGAVHILPFSEVRIILNQSKGHAYAVVDVGVAYGTDIALTEKVVRDVMAEIKAEPQWAGMLPDDVEIMGIEKLGDSSITFRFRQRCPAGQQGPLKREMLARVYDAFARAKIEIPFPTVTHIMRDPNGNWLGSTNGAPLDADA